MINIKDVSFGYSKPADTLKNINLHIKQGECVLLCGKSGCGKTTITKLVNGLIPHFTEGEYLDGSVTSAQMNVSETQMYNLSKKIGSVFQNPKSQFFNIDSTSEIAFGLENQGVSPQVIKNRINEVIDVLKGGKLLSRNIFTMSGGEKQSLAFASIHAMNPDIYVLDEPTANLDAESINILKEQIAQIKSKGKTILIAEHRLYYLMDLIDRAIYMDNGKIVRSFTRSEFISLTEKERIKMGLRTIHKEEFKNLQSEKDNSKTQNNFVVENLTYSIKNSTIFENISFSVNEGEIIGIVGENGVGKTTLMRCLAGLIKEKSGKIKFGNKVLKPKSRNNLCYMIMQDVNNQLFSDSVCGECEISGSDITDNDIEDVIKSFDLYKFRESHPMALSGGQKQRLAIATAVVSKKKVLMFDEPTSGLDYDHMVEVSKVIKKLSNQGHIIIIITHDTEFLNLTCNKIVRLNGEKVNELQRA